MRSVVLKCGDSELGDNLVLHLKGFSQTQFTKATLYIKSMLDVAAGKENEIVITLDERDTYSVYNKLVALFEDKFGCALVVDDDARSIIGAAVDEAERFAIFSDKALKIRNNVVDEAELKDFAEVLSRGQFKRTLYYHQLLSAYHIAFSHNACNFSVPGSGKTTVVLAAYDYLRSCQSPSKHVEKIVIVGPLAAFLSWENEFKECFGREPRVLEIRGGVSVDTVERALLKSEDNIDMIMISYGSIVGKEGIMQTFLKDNRDVMMVLDEAHRIKNADGGVWSSSVLRLAPLAKSRVVLTGTPAANGYADLYNLYKFIWPANDIIGYSVPQLNSMSKSPNDKRIGDLVKKISPFFIRIKKKDLGLPEPVFHNPATVRMGPLQKKVYDAISDMAVKRMQDSKLPINFKRSAAIRMRQAATNPNLLNYALENYSWDVDDMLVDGDSDILDSSLDIDADMMSIIKNYKLYETPEKFIETLALARKIVASGGKLLIWCEFVRTCDDLYEYLTSNDTRCRVIYGATLQEERAWIVERFNNPNDHEFSVLIANPHAVGESISLHKGCHNALYLEQDFNAGSYMQSKDRIHRVGLSPTDVTNYYYMHSAGTLDKNVYERVISKEQRMLKAIEAEEIPLIADNSDYMIDSEDDIKAIIRGYYESRAKI